MKKLLFLLLLIPFLGNSQATFTAPVGYNTGVPSATPSGVGTRWRFDLLTGKKYTWLPGSLSWDEDARGIDQVAGCSAPLYTPGYNQSTFAVNSCTVPELYQWTGAAWVQINDGDGNGIYGGSGTIPNGTIATITEAGTFQINYASEIPAVSISADEGFFRMQSLSGLGFLEFTGDNIFLGGESANVDVSDGLGIRYPIEYPDILTNDRSIPDVGLTKDLIAEANNIYNSDGTIPASAYRTATIGAAAALDFQYSNAATAFKISDDEEFVEIRPKDGSSFLNFSSIGTSLNTPNLSFNGGTTIADNTTLKLQGFKFQTDDDPTYNPDGFFSQLVFGGSYSIVDGSFQPAVGSSSFTAGDPLVSPTFAQFYFNGEEKSIGMQGVNIDDNLKSYIVTNQSSVTLGSNSGSDIVIFQVDATGTSFADNRATKVGIQYASDYGATFTDRSLVDKEYVDSHSGSALGTGFVNGGGTGAIPDGTVATAQGSFSILGAGQTVDDGGNISIIPSNSEDGNGGRLILKSGSSTNGSGGKLTFTAGSGIVGGAFSMFGGQSNGLGEEGGPAALNGGESTNGGKGGDISLTAGSGATNGKIILNSWGVDFIGIDLATRDLIPSPVQGTTIFCTDATANDASTGVMQVYNGSVWKNAW